MQIYGARLANNITFMHPENACAVLTVLSLHLNAYVCLSLCSIICDVVI